MHSATGHSKKKKKVATRTFSVQVHMLPPTTAAAESHGARVYFQTQLWMAKGINLNAEEWGWVTSEDRLEPLLTNLPPAPETLMKVIRCNCKTDCDTGRCTCRKLGLECSVVCGECNGINCTNSSQLPLENINLPV